MGFFFNDPEILDLIREVGHDIQLCDRSSSAFDTDFGIPTDITISNCRNVRGYVTPEQYSQIAVSSGQAPTGGYVAYISAQETKESDFRPSSVLIFDGQVYQVEYQESIFHRKKVMLHKIKLVSAFEDRSSDQPDNILELGL